MNVTVSLPVLSQTIFLECVSLRKTKSVTMSAWMRQSLVSSSGYWQVMSVVDGGWDFWWICHVTVNGLTLIGTTQILLHAFMDAYMCVHACVCVTWNVSVCVCVCVCVSWSWKGIRSGSERNLGNKLGEVNVIKYISFTHEIIKEIKILHLIKC